MPHPYSSHRPSSTDVSGGFGSVDASKDPFCAPVPRHSQVSLSSPSPRPSMTTSTMATTFSDSASSKEPHLAPGIAGVDDATALQWTAQCELPLHRLSEDGSGYHIPSHYALESTVAFDYPQDSLPYIENYNLTYSAHNPGSSCPRSYLNGLDLTGLPTNISMSESYPPSAYQIEPQKSQDVMDLSDQGISGQLLQLSDDYEHQFASNIKVEEPSEYSSVYESDVTRCSTPHDDPLIPAHGMKNECGDENTIDKEQPYAQLIYRALMEQPGHTMILRDIYNWFKDNTDKAADKETKGWQNSIRHNLSMNGAFEKVDQPCEDARKGFMWRLTDEAIRCGVKSTTRYRSKQPNKRGHRSQHPQPQRQASGAKGGQAARRSAKMRRSNRMNDAYRSERYMSRSVPASYDPAFTTRSSDMPMSYPSPPYYSSETDFSFPSKVDDFGNPMIVPALDTHPYSRSPRSQGVACHDSAYVLHQDLSEPLFSNSPSASPPADEQPLTPESPCGDWDMDMGGMPTGPHIFDDCTTAYREFM